MSDKNTDSKAEYGYQPTWDLQREKQETVANNFYEKRDARDAAKTREYREVMGEGDD